jgi:hypothetical protein
MTWTYSGDPANSEKDAVRFRTGDTDTTEQLVTDEEIAYALAEKGGVIPAAIAICRSLAAQFARKATSKTVGKLSITMSDRATAFEKIAQSLEQEGSALVVPYAGGLSISEKETAAADTSSVQPTFFRGMMENGAGTLSTSKTDS